MCCWRKKSRGFTWRGGNPLPGKDSFSFPFFCTTHVLISSHEIKRCLFLGRKVMTNLDSIFKSRDITLPTKVHLVKATVFPVVMYGCESWKADCWRIDAFELWCWRRLLESPLDCKEIQPVHPKGDQSWMFIGRDWCWSWNSNILATWC